MEIFILEVVRIPAEFVQRILQLQIFNNEKTDILVLKAKTEFKLSDEYAVELLNNIGAVRCFQSVILQISKNSEVHLTFNPCLIL